MPMLDIFDDDAFSLINMTARINKLPEVPTLIGSLNVFEEQGVTTTRVDIERRDESLTLVASSPRGGPGEVVGGETRDIRPINIPHFQRDDSVVADEVQNIRAFGTDNVLETVAGRIDMKMARHTRSFDFTMENLRLGAIKGIIVDKNGGTLLNCYTEFSIAEPAAISFELATSTTDVRSKTRQVLDAIEDALEGEQVQRVIGLAGDEFFHRFVEHDKVKETYRNWEAAVNLRGDPRMPFEFGGISWVRYHSRPKTKTARTGIVASGKMIGDNECRFVPTGVQELFITRFAPADYEETVNTPGLPRYARQYPFPNGKGRMIEMQTNVLCMCTRPEALQSASL